MTYSHKAAGRHPQRFCANGTNASPSSASSSLPTGCHQLQQEQHSNSITSSPTLVSHNTSSTGGNSLNANILLGLTGSAGNGGFFSNRKTQHHHRTHGGWHRPSAVNSTSSRCAGGNNLLPSSTTHGGNSTSRSGTTARYTKVTGHHLNNCNNNNVRSNQGGVQVLMGGIGRGLSPPLPTLTHFAGSKCFDAPSPTALPKPPENWIANSSLNASFSKSTKTNPIDDFTTHNLKLILNVQS